MSDITNTVADDTNLDQFSTEFFGQSEVEATPAKVEDVEVVPEDAQTEDTHVDTEDTSDTVDDDTLEDDAPAEKPKKNRLQGRIDELVADKMAEKRRADELALRVAELEKKQPVTPTPEPKAAASGPSPDDVKDDGTDKYPLGEFDPAYLRDFIKHANEQERAEAKAYEIAQAKEAATAAENAALQQEWQSQLQPAQERYPDFMEKSQTLVDSLSYVDPAYGEYLTAGLMSMDNGAEVLYYLANNPDEAQSIVASGPVKALVKMAAINSTFGVKAPVVQKATKVSKAPTPPPTNKGHSGVRTVTEDTDDLDSFATLLFKGK